MRVVLVRPEGYRSWYYEGGGVRFEATETTNYVRVRLALGSVAVVGSFWVSGGDLYVGLVGLEYDEDGTPVYVVPAVAEEGVVVLKTASDRTLFVDGGCVKERGDVVACEKYGYAVLCGDVCVPLAGISPALLLALAGVVGGALTLYKYFDAEKEKARARVAESIERLYGRLEEYCRLHPYDCVKAHQAVSGLLTQFRAELEGDPLGWLRGHWRELIALGAGIAGLITLVLRLEIVRAILDMFRGRR